MTGEKFRSLSGQVEEVLRHGMLSGRWRGVLPGRDRLAADLGVSHRTVEVAIRRLVGEGWLISQGGGRRRQIVLPDGEKNARRDLRVRILAYDLDTQWTPYGIELLGRLRMAGIAADFAPKSLAELGMDVGRVARLVRETPADVWIVMAGSREVLEWFSQHEVPVLAISGIFTGLPVAATGPDMASALVTALRRLVALKHRRIVMMVHTEHRKPYPGSLEQVFLDEMKALGITPGSYNLPEWEDSPEGFIAGLDRLFQHTPPTAFILAEARLIVAAQIHLIQKGIQCPRDVSMICTEIDPCLKWCRPEISHFQWDHLKMINRAVRWVNNIFSGKEDTRQILFDAEYVEGGMVGPASKNERLPLRTAS